MISPRILWGVVSLAGACLLSGCATSPAEKPRPQDDASSSTPDIRAAAELPEYPLVQADDVLFLDDALPADAAIFFVLEDRSFLAVGGEEHPIELRGPKKTILIYLFLEFDLLISQCFEISIQFLFVCIFLYPCLCP